MSIAVSTLPSRAETSFTCNIQEHILRGLVQADNVNLLILRVSHRPSTARGFPERLVERREVGSVKGRITATVQTSRETGGVQGESQQDVVTYYHENFHSQLYFITVSGVGSDPLILQFLVQATRLFSVLSDPSPFHLHLICDIFLVGPPSIV